jgi:YidC/Oxa1 family membrane protein insertase
MKMTSGDQQMAATTRGNADMAKMMKIMIYVSPMYVVFL